MLLTFIAGVGALSFSAASLVFGAPAYALLSYMTHVATFTANLSWAKTEVSVGGWQVAGMYCIIIAGALYMWWRTRIDLRNANLVE